MDKSAVIKYSTVDEYLSTVPETAKVMMEAIRKAIKQVVPEAEEVISYNMPAYRFHGILVYFAAHREHIGFYPANATLIPGFKEQLKGFATSKGTIRFPIDKKLPLALIKTIVQVRAVENLERSALKKKK